MTIFQDEGKIADEKEAFIRTVRCVILEGAQSFNMDLDKWSGPQILELVELSTFSS